MNEERFEELVGLLLDEEIAGEELDELANMVAEDPALLEELRRQLITADQLEQYEDEQRSEIAASLDFLRGLGVSDQNWVMCYPYGAQNGTLRALLGRKGCAVGLTIETGVVDVSRDDPLRLRRRDTNELPFA